MNCIEIKLLNLQICPIDLMSAKMKILTLFVKSMIIQGKN